MICLPSYKAQYGVRRAEAVFLHYRAVGFKHRGGEIAVFENTGYAAVFCSIVELERLRSDHTTTDRHYVTVGHFHHFGIGEDDGFLMQYFCHCSTVP